MSIFANSKSRSVVIGWGAAIAIAASSGCETGVGSARPAPGVSSVDGADASRVTLMREEPGGSFEVVGLVTGSADARFEGRIPEARAAAERAIRAQAAGIGADAVVLDEAFVAEIEGDGIPADGLGAGLGSGFGSGFGAGEGNLQRPGGTMIVTRPVHRVVLRGRAIRRMSQP